jgi:NTE family protein
MLSFSGGGTRAAALAYGVLQHLARTPIAGGRSLLDEVDVISSVSGGSFTAAFFALNGPAAPPRFEEP